MRGARPSSRWCPGSPDSSPRSPIAALLCCSYSPQSPSSVNKSGTLIVILFFRKVPQRPSQFHLSPFCSVVKQCPPLFSHTRLPDPPSVLVGAEASGSADWGARPSPSRLAWESPCALRLEAGCCEEVSGCRLSTAGEVGRGSCSRYPAHREAWIQQADSRSLVEVLPVRSG